MDCSNVSSPRAGGTSPGQVEQRPRAPPAHPAPAAPSAPSRRRAKNSPSSPVKGLPVPRPENSYPKPQNSPHHHGDVRLHRPYQGNHPSDHGPTQKKIQQDNRRNIPLAPDQSNNRRQKIHQKTKTEEWKEKTW